MSRTARHFALFLSAAGVLCPLPASADKIAEVREELAAKKASHQALVRKSTELNSEVNTLSENLVETSRSLRASEENLSVTDLRLKELQDRKSAYLESLYKDQQAMGGLVSAIKKYTGTPTEGMLARARPIDAARAATVMKSVMPRLQEESSYLKSQLAEIQKIENDISSQLDIQTQQKQKLRKQQDALAALLEERREMYQSTEKERRTQEQEVARLTKESKDIEDLMARIKTTSVPAHKKRLAETRLPPGILFPVRGSIHTDFGDKDDLGAPSKGITYVSQPGASVIVPLAGIVKFAGPFQKYRQILIVEHQGGYHSLIAGLARVDTVVGASLAAGEPVGIAEASAAPQIYYELRQNGKPVNPRKLLVAQRKQEKS